MALFGSPASTEFYQTRTPGQLDLSDKILKQVLGQVEGGDYGFDPIEKQARKGFSQSTIPAITDMFSSPGGEGLRSSAFQSALGRAGSDLDTNLASMKSQHQQGFLQNLLNLGMQPQFGTHHRPESGMFEGLGGGLSNLALMGLLLKGGAGDGTAEKDEDEDEDKDEGGILSGIKKLLGVAAPAAAAGAGKGAAGAGGGTMETLKGLLGKAGGTAGGAIAANPQAAAVIGTVLAALAFKKYVDSRRRR